MEKNDIKSQLEKAKLFETLPGQKGAEAMTTDERTERAETEMRGQATASMAISPESLKKAEGQIQEEVEKGVREKMAGVMEKRETSRKGTENAREAEQMGTMREGMIRTSRAAEETKGAEESEGPSMREQQSQVPRRVDQAGKATQRPRLAQGRASTDQAGEAATKAATSVFKILALPLGSGIAAGFIAWWLN